jgi:hypothetical protein
MKTLFTFLFLLVTFNLWAVPYQPNAYDTNTQSAADAYSKNYVVTNIPISKLNTNGGTTGQVPINNGGVVSWGNVSYATSAGTSAVTTDPRAVLAITNLTGVLPVVISGGNQISAPLAFTNIAATCFNTIHLSVTNYGYSVYLNWKTNFTGNVPPSHSLPENSAALSNCLASALTLRNAGYHVVVDLPGGLARFTNAVYLPAGIEMNGVGEQFRDLDGGTSTTANDATILWFDNTNQYNNPFTSGGGGGIMAYQCEQGESKVSNLAIVGMQNPFTVNGAGGPDKITPLVNMNPNAGLMSYRTGGGFTRGFSASHVMIYGFQIGLWNQCNNATFNDMKFLNYLNYVGVGSGNTSDNPVVPTGTIYSWVNVALTNCDKVAGIWGGPDQCYFLNTVFETMSNSVSVLSSRSGLKFQNCEWAGDGAFAYYTGTMSVDTGYGELNEDGYGLFPTNAFVVFYSSGNNLILKNFVDIWVGSNPVGWTNFAYIHAAAASYNTAGESYNSAILGNAPDAPGTSLPLLMDYNPGGQNQFHFHENGVVGNLTGYWFGGTANSNSWPFLQAGSPESFVIPYSYQPVQGSAAAVNPQFSYGNFGLAHDPSGGPDYLMYYGNSYRARILTSDGESVVTGYGNTTVGSNYGDTNNNPVWNFSVQTNVNIGGQLFLGGSTQNIVPSYNTYAYSVSNGVFAGTYGYSTTAGTGLSKVYTFTNTVTANLTTLVYSNASADRSWQLMSNSLVQDRIATTITFTLSTSITSPNFVQGTNFYQVADSGAVPSLYAFPNYPFQTNIVYNPYPLGFITNVNFVGGVIYSNYFGAAIQVGASAGLTTASVAGMAQLSLWVPGSTTNFSSLLTAIGVVTGTSTNGTLSAFVPAAGTYTFTNTSSGSGDAAFPVNGQILVY